MALGAIPKQVVRLILAATSRALLLWLVVGLVDAIVGSNVPKGYLYGVNPLDPIALGAVIYHPAAAVSASFAPARRASRIDPPVALRTS